MEHNPDICKEWDYDKNEIKPNEITSASHKKVWWLCEKGHSYQASISHRALGKTTGCPYCSNRKVLVGYNDLATTHQHLLKEWNYEKNSIEPTEITAGSHYKMWWKCCYFNEEYEATVEKRVTKQLGCVRCGKKMRK